MEIKNIIVSRTDKIGDLVLSIPSFYMIKKMYPNSKLTVLVRNYNYDVVKNLSYNFQKQECNLCQKQFFLYLLL